EKLLIGPQIRQLIGARRGKARQQRDRSTQPADRRHAAAIPLSAHCSPYRIIRVLLPHCSVNQKLRQPEDSSPALSRAKITKRRLRSSALCDFRGVFVAAWPDCNRPPT